MIRYKFTFNGGEDMGDDEQTFTIKDFGYTDRYWNKLSKHQQESILNSRWEFWIRDFVTGGWERELS